MPFGHCNAPSTFQRFINYIFKDLIQEGKIRFFIDDGMIATTTVEENIDILRKVFERMSEYNLELRIDKCEFLMTKVSYLGYEVCDEGIRPAESNIKSVLNYPVPRNVHDVHRFVGMCSFFRRFIKNFSIIAKPLYDIIKSKKDFVFNGEALESFEKLKKFLTEKPILAIYSPLLETELHCDASAHGYGAILFRKQSDNSFKPVCYFSRRTTDVESRYHSFELELLAVVNAIKRFRVYLQGIPFKIITDCNSIKCALSKKEIVPRISRWVLELENYNYTVEHRRGDQMRHVDALSRAIFVIEDNSIERNLSICQQADTELEVIRTRLEKEEDSVYELRNGLLYRKAGDKLLFVVPKNMINNIIKSYHDDIGHVSVEKCTRLLKQLYWFPKLTDFVKDYVDNCVRCISFNSKCGKQEGFLHPIDKGCAPFNTIHIDHLGPFNKTSRKNQYLFVVIDAFTKFVRLYATKTTKTSEVIKHLESYFSYYSRPIRIISDRGSCFTASDFANFCDSLSIKHVKIATATPRANGQVERVNRTLKPIVAKCLADELEVIGERADWDKLIEHAQYALNNTWSRVISSSPSIVLFGIKQRNDLSNLEDSISKDFVRPDLTVVRENAKRSIEKSQAENKKSFDKKRIESQPYKEGDYVMIKNHPYNPGSSTKLAPLFKGPYLVDKVLNNDRLIVKDIPGFELTQIPYVGTIATENVKKWLNFAADEDISKSELAETVDDTI